MTKTLYHYLNACFALDDIVHSRLKVSLIGKVNDDQELLAAVFADFPEEDDEKLVRQFRETMGIMCFSGDRDNEVCWNRYGDNGRGICLAFAVDARKIEQVHYVDEREEIRFPLPWREKLLRDGLTDDVANALHPYVIRKYTTKYKRTWSHQRSVWDAWWPEKEWRAFPRLDLDSVTADGRYFCDSWGQSRIKLKRVILGPSCSVPVSDVRDALKSHYRRHPYGEVKVEAANRSDEGTLALNRIGSSTNQYKQA